MAYFDQFWLLWEKQWFVTPLTFVTALSSSNYSTINSELTFGSRLVVHVSGGALKGMGDGGGGSTQSDDTCPKQIDLPIITQTIKSVTFTKFERWHPRK